MYLLFTKLGWRELMYDYIFGIRNQLPCLLTTPTPGLNLHLMSCRMTERLLHAIIEECQ